MGERQSTSQGKSRSSKGVRVGLMGIAGAGIGGVALLCANAIAGGDRAAVLARHLGLPGGIPLAAGLGACLGSWLAWRGPKALARSYGLTLGIFGAWVAWYLGRAHVWVLQVVLAGAFGSEAGVYGGLLGFLVLVAVFRLFAPMGELLLTRALRGGLSYDA